MRLGLLAGVPLCPHPSLQKRTVKSAGEASSAPHPQIPGQSRAGGLQQQGCQNGAGIAPAHPLGSQAPRSRHRAPGQCPAWSLCPASLYLCRQVLPASPQSLPVIPLTYVLPACVTPQTAEKEEAKPTGLLRHKLGELPEHHAPG